MPVRGSSRNADEIDSLISATLVCGNDSVGRTVLLLVTLARPVQAASRVIDLGIGNHGVSWS